MNLLKQKLFYFIINSVAVVYIHRAYDKAYTLLGVIYSDNSNYEFIPEYSYIECIVCGEDINKIHI